MALWCLRNGFTFDVDIAVRVVADIAHTAISRNSIPLLHGKTDNSIVNNSIGTHGINTMCSCLVGTAHTFG